jgi:hypothetical protein
MRRVKALIATIAILVLALTLYAVADHIYVHRHLSKFESLSIGSTEERVLSTMGKPDFSGAGPMSHSACTEGRDDCYGWQVSRNYMYVCFNDQRQVRCRDRYAIWH